MATERYVVLLRGINVGGRHKVLMADLRDALAEAGFTEVSTYIQSGNVLLRSELDQGSVVSTIEELLERRFGFAVPVAVRSEAEYRAVIGGAPDGFGERPDEYLCDVIFLRDGVTPPEIVEALRLRDDVDACWDGPGVVYFARLAERRGQSYLSKFVQSKLYAHVTIRNWKTTLELLRRLDDAAA